MIPLKLQNKVKHKNFVNLVKIKLSFWRNPFNFNVKEMPVILGFPLYFWLLIILFSLFKLFLLNGQHIFALGYAGHDDRLFINISYNLLRLHWFGDFNNLTLAKGPGYPMWIAFNYILGIPLLFSQNLLYILACVVLIIALKPLFLKNYFWLIIIYLVVLFNPSSFSNETAIRVFREGIYSALTLFIVAFSIGIFVRRDKIFRNIIVWIIGLSIILPFFWLTREEGVWIIPFLISILLFTAFKLWREREKQWKLKSVLLIIPFIILFFSILTVSSINYYKYGIFSTVEFNNSYFLEAYGSLTRVKDKEWQQFLPVSREKMLKIYAVSPAFKKLEPFFNGDIGQGWTKISSVLQLKNPSEIGGGWFMWAFRDAVAAAGYYDNGKDAMNYYKQLSVEIDAACIKKELDCFGKRATMMDPFYKEQIGPIFDSIIKTTEYLISFKGSDISQTVSSIGDKDSLDLFSKMTHEPIYVDSSNEIKGWAFSPSEKIVLEIVNSKGEFENSTVEISDSPDVYISFSEQKKYFNNAKRARFKISTPCTNNCFLLVTGQDNLNEKIPLDGSITSADKNGRLFVYFDDLGIKQNNKHKNVMERIDDLKLSILNNIGYLYRFSIFFLTILSLLIFLIATFIQNKKHNVLYFINLFLLFSILARIVILSIISATSFNVIKVAYLSPLYPMILIFVLLNLVSLKSLFSKKVIRV